MMKLLLARSLFPPLLCFKRSAVSLLDKIPRVHFTPTSSLLNNATMADVALAKYWRSSGNQERQSSDEPAPSSWTTLHRIAQYPQCQRFLTAQLSVWAARVAENPKDPEAHSTYSSLLSESLSFSFANFELFFLLQFISIIYYIYSKKLSLSISSDMLPFARSSGILRLPARNTGSLPASPRALLLSTTMPGPRGNS